jgi:hypothetical protein
MNKRIPCYLSVDESNDTVTLRHAKTNCLVAMFKLEAGTIGTMSRLSTTGEEDADNYWIALKHADNVVFNDGLFKRNTQVRVTAFNFTMERK